MQTDSINPYELRPCVGFPDYAVDTNGHAWSRRTKEYLGVGKGTRSVISDEWHRIYGSPDGDGYLTVGLTRDGKQYTRRIHRLVLDAFVGLRPKGMQSLHDDGNRQNNRPDNLSWGTPLKNAEDRDRHGKTMRGEQHIRSKLTWLKVDSIRDRYKAGGVSQQMLADEHGVHPSVISAVIRLVTWVR